MPMAEVKLVPGVNTQKTLALNEAGVSVSGFIRYQNGLIQKIGGWNQYYSATLTSTIKEIHAWQGLGTDQFLAVGTTAELDVITSGSASNITPQTRTNNPAPNFSVSSGSNVVTVVDAGSSLSAYDSVFFNTPVSVGTVILMGGYRVNTIGGSSTFTILATANSCTTVVSSGLLPVFGVSSGSAVATVDLPYNAFLSVPGLFYGFYATTSVGGQTIVGPYQVSSIVDSTQFTIILNSQSSATAGSTMNAGLAQLVYYITEGPPASGGGYGLGGYGLGGYGVGSGTSGSAGTAITATDWTMDNWGGVLLACPTDGPVYMWSGDGAFSTASVVTEAPFFNGGIYISQPQQILVCWKSCQPTGVQDPLLIRWSDAGDYTNWAETSQTAAGSFTLPTGSVIKGGLQAPTQGVIWTDVDVWIQQYVGGDVIFNHTRVGSGCGLIGPHAAGVINGDVYWCGLNNFFRMSGSGVEPMPCSVWDFVFQNMDTDYSYKIRCAPNSTFNEISWFFPYVGGDGENGAYVKYNIHEGEWDYGYLARAAWQDVSIVGTPLGASTYNIFQHEQGYNNVTSPINSTFETGFWSIASGNEMGFVDWVLPDMKFGTFSGSQTATCEVTFYSVDYAGGTPRTHGPYSYTSATKFINTRIRGRFMSMKIETNDIDSFYRIGSIRYRWAPAGRR